ncbi:uncharacterized protein BYT42DRAFT_551126 [Radiomyces spectabilis]|uniref:uncharacterized protein n=1 Tax=Radiomyces spectabilis TaxID=64574 RepID=UPI002220C5F0|nr:uncharacterized protein BYT42DRAFT_551126 [Radiomyces spectabilis]KAI8393464.1 hypothetical protein BYT42DRAFT_551126 [Radiomyces spectabilis]
MWETVVVFLLSTGPPTSSLFIIFCKHILLEGKRDESKRHEHASQHRSTTVAAACINLANFFPNYIHGNLVNEIDREDLACMDSIAMPTNAAAGRPRTGARKASVIPNFLARRSNQNIMSAICMLEYNLPF